MKILIETPTWLGDSVMISPAIENIVNHFDEVDITLFGSENSIEVLKNHPKVVKIHILDKKLLSIYKLFKNLKQYDIFFSFRGSLRSKITKLFISSKKKYQFNKNIFFVGHQVEKYNSFVNYYLNTDYIASNLKIHPLIKKNTNYTNKLLGINPGGSYGDAKRWYPQKFADVAIRLSSDFDIVIFGGPNEVDIANDIEELLIDYDIKNYRNLAGKTSVTELINELANLNILITGDSGPMHLAAAYLVPTIAIFGPTNDSETSQWMNSNSIILKKDLECQPCMKRTCPLNHHNCMKKIAVKDVLSAVESLN
jgi:heptosyltransferase II